MTSPAARKRGRYQVEVGGQWTAPSVSSVIECLKAFGLEYGAAKETALRVINDPDTWYRRVQEDRDKAYNELRTHFKSVWSDKARLGSTVHDIAHQWAVGKKAMHSSPESAPYLEALRAFFKERKPTFIQVERTVLYSEPEAHSYGGTFDAVAYFDGRRYLLDYKTSRTLHCTNHALQLAAYRNAQHMGIYNDKGELVNVEWPPVIEATAIVWLRPNGTYQLVEIPTDKATFNAFLRLRSLWTFTRQMEAWQRANVKEERVPVDTK